MAMGGAMKGHLHSNGSRGRSYGLVLLLVFGIAIFGVMVIHKLRERRMFNLLVKEKDRQLISIQLLLQLNHCIKPQNTYGGESLAFGFVSEIARELHKRVESTCLLQPNCRTPNARIFPYLRVLKEREYGKEAKWKIEEMKAKMHTLRLQKMERDNRILEMQSTISSLRDEERMIELALEEKQNEIKQLRQRYIETKDKNDQAKALSEILRQKEAEIEDLKQRLELPVKVRSANTDDPANPALNATAKASRLSRDERKVNEDREESGKSHESITGKLRNNTTQDAEISNNQSANYSNNKSATQGDDRRENGQIITHRSKMTGEEQSQKLEGSQNGGFEHGSTYQNRDKEYGGMNIQGSENGKMFGIGERKNNGYESDAIHDHGSVVQKPGDEAHGVRDTGNEEVETRGNEQPGKIQNFENLGVNYKSGMKLEMPENLHGGGYTFRGKHGDIRRIRGKTTRITAKSRENNGNSETDGLAGTRDTRIVKSTSDMKRYEKLRDENSESMDKDNERSMELKRNRSAPVDLNATGHDKLPQDEGSELKIDQPIGLEHHRGKERVEESRAENNRKKSEDSPPRTTFLMHEKLEDAEDTRQKVGKTDHTSQATKGLHSTNTSLGDTYTSVEQAPPETTINSVNNRTLKEARKQKPDEAEEPEKHVIIQPNNTVWMLTKLVTVPDKQNLARRIRMLKTQKL